MLSLYTDGSEWMILFWDVSLKFEILFLHRDPKNG